MASLIGHLIVYMKKSLDSDWLRAVQFKCNTSAKSITPVQKVNTRENEVREHIPVPDDNLFQSILSSRHAVKVIFILGPGRAGNGQPSSGCVHLNKKLII